jgi:AraC family transcriptional regulator, transcriptional activator of pobA
LLIVGGGGYAKIDGANYLLAPGTAMLVPPFSVHEFQFEAGTDGFVASIGEALLQRLFDHEILGLTPFSKPLILSRGRNDVELLELESTMGVALAEFARNRPSREVALTAHAGLLAAWFSRVAQQQASVTNKTKNPRLVLLQRFVQEIEREFREHQSLAVYARTLGVSGSHLSRICREILGCPPSRVVHERLMLEARRYLIYTSMPISQIAFALGFPDSAYFSRFFSARSGGISPSAYRAAN